jgi:DNA-binding NarL/FixJ family response regulator
VIVCFYTFRKEDDLTANSKITILYVENDSALRGLVTSLLRKFSAVENVIDFATGEEAIIYAKNFVSNVALLDVSLGQGVLDGFATGTELRKLNPDIGVVLFSQNPLEAISELIDFKGLEAWSYVEKKADLNIEELVKILITTSLGMSNRNWAQFKKDKIESNSVNTNVLTPRQNMIMSLLSCGYEAKFIADKIEISVESVRKDLSAAYSVLIPNPEPGSDLRISAILKYQNLIGNLGLNEI